MKAAALFLIIAAVTAIAEAQEIITILNPDGSITICQYLPELEILHCF